ncbi:dipeptide epimerase [Christensenellaceae bacterium OttesenSCG-928-M15]|nr:dipeptide epimerase [Christensenellaceae bacterium OttesenSCG-928-M15]
MKIANITLKEIRIQLYEPFRVAFGEIDFVENVLVKIETDEGITGYGEAAPMPFVTGETVQSVLAMLNMLKRGLIGMNPLAIDSIHTVMDGVAHANSSAKCAIDLALYDIMGKALNKPVYQVLGGESGVVHNDVTIGIDAPERMAEKALYYVRELGYRILKIKAGICPDDDVRAIGLIREAVGADVRLRVDANQGYDIASAVKTLDRFVPYNIEAVEQCLPDWDFEGSAYVRKKVRGIEIMLDESIHGPRDAARACKLGAADILNIKLMKCGGLYPATEINAIAQSFGVTCMVGCMLETPLAITAGLSLVAAKTNVTEADCDSFMYYDTERTGMKGGFSIENGVFTLSEAPGFGIEIGF